MTTPNGCAQCGKAQGKHAIEWGPRGYHTWVEPTDAQRKERMLRRRRDTERLRNQLAWAMLAEPTNDLGALPGLEMS